MQRTWLGPCLVVLAAASCGFPQLPDLPDSDGGGPSDLDLELLAGNADGSGSVDGTGAAARFSSASSVAIDGAGTVYVADRDNHTIRRITAAGVVTTLAGTPRVFGSADGTGAAARFRIPTGVAVDGAGNVYVTDTGNHTLRKVTTAGVVTTLAGTAGMAGSADGTGAAARFSSPQSVAVDSAGIVYVADTGNHTLRKVTAAGVVTTLAGTPGMPGSADGTGAAARFSSPQGVAVDGAGTVYVADTNNDTLRKVTAAGAVTTLAGAPGMPGSIDGTGTGAQFQFPKGAAVDGAGNAYVADTGNNTLRKVTAAGVVTTLAGAVRVSGSADGTRGSARFDILQGLAVDGAGTVYAADHDTIRKITAAGAVTTLAGTAGASGSADGTGAAAQFNGPLGVGVDSAGNAYVADSRSATLRKVTGAGVVTTLAGTPYLLADLDGTGTDALFFFPTAVAVDSAGNVYLVDSVRHSLRKVTSAGVVTTLAGTPGMAGSADGTGADARFNGPTGVAVDGAGNVYIADSRNHTVRKVTAAGVATTLAGSPGVPGSADGTGADARFNFPASVAVDGAGNAYVTDGVNHTVRKITAAGVVTTLAGAAGMTGSADGTGVAARFHSPLGVAVDGAGNVYVADTVNSTIRKITPTGVTTTVAGTAGLAGVVLGQPPRLAFPQYLAIVGDSLVVSDNNAILLLRHGAK